MDTKACIPVVWTCINSVQLRFRQSKFHETENIREHLNKLRPLLCCWLVPPARPDITDAEYITEILQRQENEFMIEQLCNGASYNLQKHLDERNPITVEELCQCVEPYQFQHTKMGQSDRRTYSHPTQQRRTGNTAQNSSTITTPRKDNQATGKTPEQKRTVTCYKCGNLDTTPMTAWRWHS